jgi:cytochrome c peroxidase
MRLPALFATALLGSALLLSPRAAEGQRAPLLPPVTGLDELFPVPEDNPLTATRIDLGRRLFFDRMLSRNRTLTCASCHRPDHGFSDPRARSLGVRGAATRRHTPTLLNRAYGSFEFWDGRAETLESQVLQPVQDSLEMDLPVAELLTRLRAQPTYLRAFAETFGSGPNATTLAQALASFVRTLRSGNSAFDRYREGQRDALSQAARRGLALFNGRANCSACHIGANFTDERFHNTGVTPGSVDPGRFALTGDSAEYGAFKTPTLREVARTAPYMHDGSLGTLEQVIDLYDRGGGANRFLDRELHTLHLSPGDKRDLLDFLRSLTGTARAR